MALRDLDLAADIDFMVDDAGVPVIIGDVSGFGIFDENSLEGAALFGLEVQKRATTLLVRSGQFPDLYKFCPVSVQIDGETRRFKTDDSQLQDDGSLTLLLLSRRTT